MISVESSSFSRRKQVEKFLGKISIKIFLREPNIAYSYGDIYCDVNIPADVDLGQKFDHHFTVCGGDTPTHVEASQHKFFRFNNQGAAINHRFSGEICNYCSFHFL